MNGNTLIVPITDFLRRHKYYGDQLRHADGMTLTLDGWPYLDVKLNNRERNKALLEFVKTIDPKLFDNDEVWKAVAVRRNRKKPITL